MAEGPFRRGERSDGLNQLKVTGISERCTKDFLEIYFENKKKFGRSIDVIDVELNERERYAVIRFKDPEDVKTVLAVHQASPCMEHDHVLSLDFLSSYGVDNLQRETRTIVVRGFGDNTSKENLMYYFENTTRSGGGPTESVSMKEDKTVLITFKQDGVIDRVLQRSHEIDKHNLTVTKFVVSKRDILFTDVSPNLTDEAMEHYCEAKLKQDVECVVYSQDKTKVLVRFKGPIDYRKAERACLQYKLDGYLMTPGPVPVTDAVIVTNISDSSTEDSFRFYFENRNRSSGGTVYDIKLESAEEYCLVFFKEPTVVESVCSQEEHYLDGMFLKVDPFYACLGLPDGFECRQFTFPDPISLDNLNSSKLSLLENNDMQKDEFTKKLHHIYATVCWENKKIHCSLTSSVRDYKNIARSWTDKVNAVINEFDEMTEVHEFSFASEERAEIKDCLETVDIDDINCVQVKIDVKQRKIKLVAKKDFMNTIARKVEQAIDKAKEDFKKKKERKTEKKQLSQWKIRYLKAVAFKDTARQMFPQVDIDIYLDSSEISLSGPKDSVSETLLEIFRVLDQVQDRRVQMEPGKMKLLSREQTTNKISQQMRDSKLGDVWEVKQKNNEVVLHADELGDLKRMENIIENMLNKISIDIDSGAIDLLKSREWKDLESTLQRECSDCVVIEERGSKVDIYTINEYRKNVDEKVKDFFAKNAKFKDEITLDANILKYIKKYKLMQLESEIKTELKKEKTLSFDQTKVTFEGNAEDIKAIKRILKKYEVEVKCKPSSLNKRGIYTYITSENGRQAVATVEMSAQCIIDVLGKGLGSSIGKGKKRDVGRNFDKPMHCAEAVLRSRQKVIVYGGDMTMLSVDVIVNASNKEMQHVGGLAAVIKRKGGSDIQRECEDYVKRHGSLKAGDVFMSQAGKLKCQAIAHAVGPVWNDGQQGEKDDLELATKNCLKETDARQLKSIAFPALSAGVFGYPVNEACLVIAKTVKAYFKATSGSSIEEVYLCDISIKTAQKFVEAATSTFKDCKLLADLGAVGGVGRQQAWLTESEDQQEAKSPFGNTVVSLVKGDITKQRVDVIVNSASHDLHLEKGKSSAALSRAGGSKIQQECKNKYPKGIQTGEVAKTTGGKLPCSWVFHIALEPYKKQKTMHPIAGLKKSVEECLSLAEGSNSIAFPALGTGAQSYPRDKVAREMFGTVADYCKKNPKTTLTTVKFVVFSQDDETFEAFISEEKHFLGQEDVRGTQRDSAASGVGKVVKVQRDYGEFKFGSIQVKVFQGDIATQNTVAIVASCNRDLDLSKGAVTQALLKQGGQEIASDCAKQRSEMQKTGITITTAGQLHSKYIIHVDTKYKLKEWEPVMLECLEVAEKHKFSSISFPALGTSVKCKPEDIAVLLSSAMGTFLQQSPQHLQKVCVVVYKKDMLGPFIDGMKNSVTSADQSQHRNSHTRQPSSRRKANQPKQAAIEDTCSLIIYGKDDYTIDKASKQLQARVDETWIEKKIEKIDELSGLHKSKMESIRECAKTNHVLIEIDTDRGEITLVGIAANIITVDTLIHKILRDFNSSRYERKLANSVSKTIKWFYVKDNTSFPFPDRENLKLETAFSNKVQSVRIKDRSGGEYEINFKDMKEWDVKKPAVKFSIIRKDLIDGAGHEIPKHWMMMPDGQQLKVISLNSNDQEYKDVIQDFTSTLGRQATIVKVERIQNVTLYTQYMAKKRQMEISNPKGKNERILWHGTDVKAVDSINNHGFNRSYCGKNATALGAGVYFAVNTAYSDQPTYTQPDASGHKHMYRTRVLTGQFTTGNSSLRVPPAKDPANPHLLYDSVTNNMGNPIMFVIFHDTQAYPEHIISYK